MFRFSDCQVHFFGLQIFLFPGTKWSRWPEGSNWFTLNRRLSLIIKPLEIRIRIRIRTLLLSNRHLRVESYGAIYLPSLVLNHTVAKHIQYGVDGHMVDVWRAYNIIINRAYQKGVRLVTLAQHDSYVKVEGLWTIPYSKKL